MTSAATSSQRIEEANYQHLIWDIAWYGLAMAATTRFLQFYALEMGASAMDLGWLTALPALVVMFTTVLSPWWRRQYSDSIQAVMIPGFIQRLLFVLPAFAPFFPEPWRVPWIILASTLPMIGQGAVSAIFIVMMRETVSEERLQLLVTRRHLAINVAMTAGAIGFGLMLEALPFPINYQLMFVIAFLFALMSQWHLTRLRVLQPEAPPQPAAHRSYRQLLADAGFRSVAVVLLLAFGAHHLIVSVIPIQLKDALGATEGYLGLYGALEVVSAFAITLGLNRLMQRFGNRRLIAIALGFNALAALVVAFAPNRDIALLSAVLTGASWSVMGVCTFAYFAERTARDDMQAAIVYHQIIFAAIFVTPLIGSGLVNMGASVVSVLVLGFVVRLVAAGVCEFVVDQRKAKPYQGLADAAAGD